MRAQRWEPFQEMASFSSAVKAMLDEGLGQVQPAAEATLVPATDVSETSDAYYVYVNMPGLGPDDVSVMVHGNVVSISGEPKVDEKAGEGKWLLKERLFGKYSRSITFSASLDPDKVVARFERGVLHLHLQKAARELPRQIRLS